MAPAHWSIDCFFPLHKKKETERIWLNGILRKPFRTHNSLLGGGPWLRQCVTPLPAPLQLTATNDVPIVRHQMPLPPLAGPPISPIFQAFSTSPIG